MKKYSNGQSICLVYRQNEVIHFDLYIVSSSGRFDFLKKKICINK